MRLPRRDTTYSLHASLLHVATSILIDESLFRVTMKAEPRTVQEKIALRRGVEAQVGLTLTVLVRSHSFVAHLAVAMRRQVVAIDKIHDKQETLVCIWPMDMRLLVRARHSGIHKTIV